MPLVETGAEAVSLAITGADAPSPVEPTEMPFAGAKTVLETRAGALAEGNEPAVASAPADGTAVQLVRWLGDEAGLERLVTGTSASRLTNLTAICFRGLRLKKLSTVQKYRYPMLRSRSRSE